jgi:hypothetical protein
MRLAVTEGDLRLSIFLFLCCLLIVSPRQLRQRTAQSSAPLPPPAAVTIGLNNVRQLRFLVEYTPTARLKRGERHLRQIEDGDPVVLKIKNPREGEPAWAVGEVRFEPGKIVLVSHRPASTRRAFGMRDVIMLGRVETVTRSIYDGPFYKTRTELTDE